MKRTYSLVCLGVLAFACSNDSDTGSKPGGNGGGGGNCFAIPAIDRVRIYPAAGDASAMVGGKIAGSNQSPTDGFVDLVSITTAPTEGQWLELTVPSAKSYRFVKYYGPAANRGDIAELELYAGSTKVSGSAFGTQPESTASAPSAAFDGDQTTSYRGAVENDQYVGLDVAAGHVV